MQSGKSSTMFWFSYVYYNDSCSGNLLLAKDVQSKFKLIKFEKQRM